MCNHRTKCYHSTLIWKPDLRYVTDGTNTRELDHFPIRKTLNASMSSTFVHHNCKEEIFKSVYVRNNKSSGHKNLRCFPHCCGGHRAHSFCGASLEARYHGSDQCAMAIGRFEPADNEPFFQRGEHYNKNSVQFNIKTDSDPFGEWHVGEQRVTSTFAFNTKKKRSWHYGARVDGVNRNLQHLFRVYFFDKAGRCIDTLSSPPFSITSSRRIRSKTRKESPSTEEEPFPSAKLRKTNDFDNSDNLLYDIITVSPNLLDCSLFDIPPLQSDYVDVSSDVQIPSSRQSWSWRVPDGSAVEN